jgi:hypothetical protein
MRKFFAALWIFLAVAGAAQNTNFDGLPWNISTGNLSAQERSPVTTAPDSIWETLIRANE